MGLNNSMESDESVNRVTRLAARTLGVPIAVVSAVDGDGEWIKSRVGLEISQLPLEMSFSVQALREQQTLVVPDAARDARFAGNSLVTRQPFVRAYMGTGLYTQSGKPIGTLSAMDCQPRHFDAADIATWNDFAGIVQGILHAKELFAETDLLLYTAAISEQKHNEVERRLQRIADSIPALIGYWNMDLRCEFANDAYRAYFGRTPQQMVGMHLRELLGDRLFELNSPHAYAALAGEAQRFQRRVTRADGVQVDTEGQYLPDRDETGALRGFYVLVTDVTELTAAKAELEVSNAKLLKESTTDFLTRLANRRVFSEKSDSAYLRFRNTGEHYAVILLDLDDFKHINDSLGHEVGDEVLRELGRILNDGLQGREGMAARLGGEEFAILCPGMYSETALKDLAGSIREVINKTRLYTRKGVVTFTSSFGISCSGPEDSSWTNVFARADGALYEAKAAGKDRIVFGYSPANGATGRFRSMGIPRAGL